MPKYQYDTNLRAAYLFQLSQWIKTWTMQSNFNFDLYFLQYFANQLPGFSIDGTFGMNAQSRMHDLMRKCTYIFEI